MALKDLSVATFNLLNLQIPGGLTYSNTPPFPETAEGRLAYDRKIGWTGRKLVELDAEVIAFQELWSRRALEDAFNAAGLLGSYDLVARDAPGRGRPQVALAVRKDRFGNSQLLPGADWIARFPETFRFDKLRETAGAEEEITVTINEFSRPVLAAQIQPEGDRPTPPPVTVYVAHLKSKGPARLSFAAPRPTALQNHAQIVKSAVSHIRRVMEAGALRAILDDTMRAAEDDDISPTILLGDLNDGALATTTEMLSAEPGYRVFAKSRAGGQSDRGLYSVERLQQFRSLRHVYYTHIYRHKRESLDHILVSEEFYDFSRKRLWSFREMEVINDHLNRESFEDSLGASDHGIVRAVFDWNPMDDPPALS